MRRSKMLTVAMLVTAVALLTAGILRGTGLAPGVPILVIGALCAALIRNRWWCGCRPVCGRGRRLFVGRVGRRRRTDRRARSGRGRGSVDSGRRLGHCGLAGRLPARPRLRYSPSSAARWTWDRRVQVSLPRHKSRYGRSSNAGVSPVVAWNGVRTSAPLSAGRGLRRHRHGLRKC